MEHPTAQSAQRFIERLKRYLSTDDVTLCRLDIGSGWIFVRAPMDEGTAQKFADQLKVRLKRVPYGRAQDFGFEVDTGGGWGS